MPDRDPGWEPRLASHAAGESAFKFARPDTGTALSAGLAALSDRLWANKQAKGFNITDVPLEVAFLHAEVAEAFDAWRKGGDIGSELADVLLFTLSLARMTGTDLGAEALAKIAVNEAREYVLMPSGLHVQREATRDGN